MVEFNEKPEDQSCIDNERTPNKEEPDEKSEDQRCTDNERSPIKGEPDEKSEEQSYIDKERSSNTEEPHEKEICTDNERTPNKREPYDKSEDQSCTDSERTPNNRENEEKSQEQTCIEKSNATEQFVRRSKRKRVKTKRYEDTPPEKSKKIKLIQSKNSQKSKDVTKRKTESISEKQQQQQKSKTNQMTKMVKHIPSPQTCRKCFAVNQTNLFKFKKRRKFLSLNKVQKFLMELDPPSPPKVPVLTLNDMTVQEIMGTFEPNKNKLDALFQQIKSEGYIYCYEGISHYLVIELLTNDMQRLMMDKLSENYETESNPKYGSHVINVLMPEWILNIFMERYNMERNDAIRHIKEQNSYTVQLIGHRKNL